MTYRISYRQVEQLAVERDLVLIPSGGWYEVWNKERNQRLESGTLHECLTFIRLYVAPEKILTDQQIDAVSKLRVELDLALKRESNLRRAIIAECRQFVFPDEDRHQLWEALRSNAIDRGIDPDSDAFKAEYNPLTNSEKEPTIPL